MRRHALTAHCDYAWREHTSARAPCSGDHPRAPLAIVAHYLLVDTCFAPVDADGNMDRTRPGQHEAWCLCRRNKTVEFPCPQGFPVLVGSAGKPAPTPMGARHARAALRTECALWGVRRALSGARVDAHSNQ